MSTRGSGFSPVVCGFALALACLAPGIAAAQADSGPLDGLSKRLKLTADPVEPADFVKNSRPAELNFVPVGGPRPEPKGKLLTLDEIRAKEAELDAVGARHDQIAGRKHARVAYNPIAQEPKRKPPKKPVSCAITCEVKPNTPPAR